MNTSVLVEWQRIDLENGLIEPWLTWPFMDKIKTWDLSQKVMLETGGGRSTSWWRRKCKWVDTIEANPEWAKQAELDCINNRTINGRIFCSDIPDGTEQGMKDYFNLFPNDRDYDIVVVDGIYRVECIEWAINHFKDREGILIIDNLDQDFVFISPKAMELIAPYKGEVFIQPGHINHEGKPWNTRYHIIPA